MAVGVHVTSTIERGRFAEFLEAVEDWRDYRRLAGVAVPEVLQGLSGEMNAVRLVFRYPDLAAYEREEAAEAADPEYARVAMRKPFAGPLEYAIYRALDVADRPEGR